MDENQNYDRLKGFYARLKGMKGALGDYDVYDPVPTQYNNIFTNILELVTDNEKSEIDGLQVEITRGEYASRCHANGNEFASNINQLISWLDSKYRFSDDAQILGGLIGQIQDKEIQNRCLDLLSGSSDFDRSVAQATQIFENRISIKSGVTGIGVKLVNEAIKKNPSDSILVINDDANIQEGFAHLSRGIMMFLRNPSHHFVNSDLPKEDAIKICAFIDLVLKDVDNARVNKN